MNEMRPVSTEMPEEDVLRYEIGVLRSEHRALDAELAGLKEAGRADALTVRRLKKQKLALKDRIARLEDRLFPDIIA